MNRIEQILEWLKENPQDEFLNYALGIEYLRNDRPKALQIFEKLLAQTPDYLPSYYQTAQILAEDGQWQKAKQLYKAGIELSQKQQDHKTHQELRKALQYWIDEYEL